MNQIIPPHLQFDNLSQASELGGILSRLFLSAATHSIREKSLPQLGDGLLPVARRQLMSMQDVGATSKKHHVTANIVVSHTQGYYHPAGDNYDSLVTQSQAWRVQLPMTDPDGNWGPIESNKAAAARYTKIRLSQWAEMIMLADLPDRQKADDVPHGIVPQRGNYDSTLLEPEYLPSRLPMLLINGGAGIATAFAQSWPQLNVRDFLREFMVFLDTGTLDLRKVSFGYPTLPVVAMSQDEVITILERGTGAIRMASQWHAEPGAIVFTSIPPDTTLNGIGDKANAQLENVTCPFTQYRNETEKTQVRLVFKLKDGVTAEEAATLIIHSCGLVNSETIQQYALVNNRPVLFGATAYVKAWTEMRHGQLQRIANRELQALLRNLRRLDILEFVRNHLTDKQVENSVSTILQTANDAEAILSSLRLHQRALELDLNSEDVKIILDLNLRSVSRLADDEIINRRAKLNEEITHQTSVRDDEAVRVGIIKDQVQEILAAINKAKHPDYRCTYVGREFLGSGASVLSKLRPKSATLREIIEEEGELDIILTTANGFIVRLPSRSVSINRSRPNILNGGDMIIHATFHDRANLVFIDDEGKISSIKKSDMDAKASHRYHLLNQKFGTKISGAPVLVTPSGQKADKLVLRYGHNWIKVLDMDDQLPSIRAIIKPPEATLIDATVGETAIIINGPQHPLKAPIASVENVSRSRTGRLPIFKYTGRSTRIINKAAIHTDGNEVWRVNY